MSRARIVYDRQLSFVWRGTRGREPGRIRAGGGRDAGVMQGRETGEE